MTKIINFWVVERPNSIIENLIKRIMEVNFKLGKTQSTDLTADQSLDDIQIISQDVVTTSEDLDHSKANFTDPVSITAIVTVVYLIKSIVRFLIKDKEQGVQMDLRTIPVSISRISGVPAGFLVIIDKEGVASTQKIDYEKDENILQIVTDFINQYLKL